MNSSTIQGNGNVAYIPVVIDKQGKRTKADRIRSMTDEELAEWLYKSDPECYPPEWWLNWLRQEAKDGE